MTEVTEQPVHRTELMQMAGTIVSAYVGKNQVSPDKVPEIIGTVYASLQSLSGGGAAAEAEPPKPAVSVRSSVKPDHIVCLEDGQKFKVLKRHLRSDHGLTPEEYRARWGLSRDYPMVAPNYAEQRSAFAKKIGLGRKAGQQPKRRRAKAS